MTKRCGTCRETKPLADFSNYARSADGKQSRCKSCAKEADRQRYLADPQAVLDRVKAQRVSTREWIQTLKGRPCHDCGGSFHFSAMDFDHRPDEVKSYDISHMLGRAGRKRIIEELGKCDLVCANCHRVRTYRRMVGMAGIEPAPESPELPVLPLHHIPLDRGM